jgi:flagellin
MSRIGVSLSGIERRLLSRLAEANAAATLSSLRMATGSKINFPRDDPSAFVMLSGLQSQLGAVRSAMSNVTAAASMVSQMQATLESVRTQLDTIRTELLKDEDRTLTTDERAEAQANIDAAITQINTLAATPTGGRRLLDGSADFYVSGRDFAQVSDLRVYSTGGSTLSIYGSVTQAATQAELVYAGKEGSQVEFGATFTLSGERGSVEITVSGDQQLSDVATTINDNSHKTGVTAAVDGNALTFTSVDYGSQANVAIVVSAGSFDVTGGNGDGTANGTDVAAEIGGRSYTGDGNQLSINQNHVRYTIELVGGISGNFGPITVDGDALTFALSAEVQYRSTLAIPSLLPARLGGVSGALSELADGGLLSGLDDKTSRAIRVVDEALADLSRIEAAVDGFYNASISSASGLLADLQNDLEDAIDDVNLVDDTEESARLAYYQNLAANGVAGLAILCQQRSGIVNLLQQIAGLSPS